MQYLDVCHLQANNKRWMLYRKERKASFSPRLLLLAFLCFLSAPCSNVVLSACATMPDRRSLLLTIKVPHFLQEKVNNE